LAPGIAVAEGLVARGHQVALLVSRKRVDARLSAKYPALEFIPIPGAGLSWRPDLLVRFLWAQLSAFALTWRLIRSRRPAALLGFGGFTSAPAALCGFLLRIPVALHEANRVTGRAVRVLSPLARRVYLPPPVGGGADPVGPSVDPAQPSCKLRHLSLPVRQEFARQPADTARSALGLLPGKPLLVVLGGSQGASALNGWTRLAAPALLAEGLQLLCVTGMGKDAASLTASARPAQTGPSPVLIPFCDRMPELLSAATLVVSRAGAGTIAELIRCHTPSVLVPFPQAADDHQRANAEALVRQGGALLVPQAQLDTLLPTVLSLLRDAPRLAALRTALALLDTQDPLPLLLSDLAALAEQRSGKREARSEKGSQ
jgi:UDP-N-acetylglucosamine--N-acetylmuramyl-(pentapeptide) pyrophosphoryl-undecaprenol N-acetylglucosamine transferase